MFGMSGREEKIIFYVKQWILSKQIL